MNQGNEGNHDDKKIHVIISYVGDGPYVGDLPGGMTIGAVKEKAMEAFSIEASAAGRYKLQVNGVDVNEKMHLRSFEKPEVSLTLELVDEVPKG